MSEPEQEDFSERCLGTIGAVLRGSSSPWLREHLGCSQKQLLALLSLLSDCTATSTRVQSSIPAGSASKTCSQAPGLQGHGSVTCVLLCLLSRRFWAQHPELAEERFPQMISTVPLFPQCQDFMGSLLSLSATQQHFHKQHRLRHSELSVSLCCTEISSPGCGSTSQSRLERKHCPECTGTAASPTWHLWHRILVFEKQKSSCFSLEEECAIYIMYLFIYYYF